MHRLSQAHKKEKPNGQSHGNRNVYSQSNYLPSQEKQKPVGSSQTSKTIIVPPIQAVN